jgi:hypothetical protein
MIPGSAAVRTGMKDLGMKDPGMKDPGTHDPGTGARIRPMAATGSIRMQARAT